MVAIILQHCLQSLLLVHALAEVAAHATAVDSDTATLGSKARMLVSVSVICRCHVAGPSLYIIQSGSVVLQGLSCHPNPSYSSRTLDEGTEGHGSGPAEQNE